MEPLDSPNRAPSSVAVAGPSWRSAPSSRARSGWAMARSASTSRDPGAIPCHPWPQANTQRLLCTSTFAKSSLWSADDQAGASLRSTAARRRQWRKWRIPVMSIVRAGGVDDRDRLGVADRAAGLGERGDARRQADLDGVRERVERVRGAGGAARSRPARASRAPWRRPGGRRRPARSGRSHPDQPAVPDEHDRVRGDAADQPPGEVEVDAARRPSGSRRVAHGPRRSGRR